MFNSLSIRFVAGYSERKRTRVAKKKRRVCCRCEYLPRVKNRCFNTYTFLKLFGDSAAPFPDTITRICVSVSHCLAIYAFAQSGGTGRRVYILKKVLGREGAEGHVKGDSTYE